VELASVDIFSEENCQFIQDYRRLFQLPELFKPKKAFSEMRNNQTGEEEEKSYKASRLKM
jgi:hypothetical protein